MPQFENVVVEETKRSRINMSRPRIERSEDAHLADARPTFSFVSQKVVHDCIVHAIRDQRANIFWRAVEGMSQSRADLMPFAFVPFTTRSPSSFVVATEGWGGRWPVGMLGVTFGEAEQIFAFAKTFPEWEDDYPALTTRILAKAAMAP